MRKHLFVLLALLTLVCAITLAACNNQSANPTDTTVAETTGDETTVAETTGDLTTPKETTAEETTAEGTAATPDNEEETGLPEHTETETDTPALSLKGKTLSILGDSISTFAGVSNNTSHNATIGNNLVYYSNGFLNVYQQDTWWQQALNILDMDLLVNNSYSGSCIFQPLHGANGAYIDRCTQLHNAKGKTPDLIAIFMGTNDFGNFKDKLGSAADINYETLILTIGSNRVYSTPKTAAEAYAIMLHKAMTRYPDAEVYCFTLLPERVSDADVALLEQFNQTIIDIATHFGAYVVDLYRDSGVKYDDNFAFYVADNELHPGPAGMDAITNCFISSILENSKYVTDEVYNVSYDLDNVIVNEGTAYAARKDDSFECTLTPPAGHDMTVTVTMDGQDITSTAFNAGKINIPAVKGDIIITVQAKRSS